MLTLIQREFIVEVPLETAWRYLAQVERWPSWASHIKRVELAPVGGLTANSRGLFHLSNGIKSEFQMAEFNLSKNWRWTGPFLWLHLEYDHRFEAINQHRTRLTWIVRAKGFAVSLFGRFFAMIYNRNLDRAIPNLVAEMSALESKAAKSERPHPNQAI